MRWPQSVVAIILKNIFLKFFTTNNNSIHQINVRDHALPIFQRYLLKEHNMKDIFTKSIVSPKE